MEFTLFLWGIAALPILLLLFLMSYIKMKSRNAAFVSLLITSIFAVLIAPTQSIGGSLGAAIAPAKILLGTSVVGIAGKEGEIIKRCIGYTMINAFLVGLIALIIGQLI